MKTKAITISASLIVFCLFGFASQIDAQTKSQASVKKNPDFDFLVGEWRIHHRRLKPGSSTEWIEFEGTCRNRPLMEGAANVEEYFLNVPGNAYRAVGLRSYDAKTDQWSIWWLDSRYISVAFKSAVRGRFENSIGTFYADQVVNGKPLRVRFIWSEITADSARWEQALSFDEGKTWQPNWIMNWRRASTASEKSSSDFTKIRSRDFDFLDGRWRVKHQYLRANSTDNKWAKADGEADHFKFTDGWVNLDEYKVNAPSGAYQAVALRYYDPKTQEWLIWWLDGRSPSADFEPPVKGRFEKGVGTFYGDTTVNEKPIKVRFIWSKTTAKSARWEQAYSSDGGKTWETNWIMDFQRN